MAYQQPIPRPTPNELDQFFALPGLSIYPRLVLSLDASDKEGKTHYALMTTPCPVRVISNDTGTEIIAQKARSKGRDVKVMYLDIPDPNPSVTAARDVDPEDLTQWRKEWERAKSSLLAIGRDKTIRTLVVDTAGKLWNLCLLAHFGKMKKIPQHLREAPNSDFYSVLWTLYKQREDLNIILLHLMKKRYSPNSKGDQEWDGGYERSGWNQIGGYVDMTLRSGWDGVRRSFYTEVDYTRATRFGAELSGRRWYGEENSFWNLGMEVFPETEGTPEVWGR